MILNSNGIYIQFIGGLSGNHFVLKASWNFAINWNRNHSSYGMNCMGIYTDGSHLLVAGTFSGYSYLQKL